MEKTRLEKEGRVFIPKKVRERLGMRSGEEMLIEERDGALILRKRKSPEEFSSQLKGCVKGGGNPLDLKKMWRM
ncbi:MAG: AbrB/MazE/SpoVT family DNA-binding domain-containing protein [Candidatus Aenigmarchaeota archaeon]|nr:AbrB/MazE/SpoVT family DNA-binding domain-containing protein [Candidatus Aenigmarchaeota archaeon]